MENSSEGPAIVGAAVLGAKALSKKSRSKRKGKRSERLEKRAKRAESKGKSGKAEVLRAKKKVVDTKKKNVDKKIAAKDDKKKKKAKRVGMAVLTGGASEAHRAKGKVKKAVKAKKEEVKGKVKAGVKKVKDAADKAKRGAKAKIHEKATAIAGKTAPGMYGANKHDYKEHMDAAGHETKDGVVGGGKYGKGGHYKDYEGPSMADSDRLTGAGSEGDPGLGRMSEGDKSGEAAGKAGLILPKGPGMYGRGSKISYGNHQKPNMHKGNGKVVHGSPFNLGGSKLSKHFKK